MNCKLSHLAVVVVTCGTVLAMASCSPQDPLLSADLAFNFRCTGIDRSVLEHSIEDFLKVQEFKVLNIGRIRRERGAPAPHDDTHLISIDNSKRRIEIIADVLLPEERDSQRSRYYFVKLNSPPPTRRSPDLEEALLTFVPGKLSCGVANVVRGGNDANKRTHDNSEIARIEGLFRQAEICRKAKEVGKNVPGSLCPEWPGAMQPNRGVQPTHKNGTADAKR